MEEPKRNKSVSSKVTEQEYSQLKALAEASGLNLSEWCREALLSKLEAHPAEYNEQTILAELLGLRAILLNLLYRLSKGQPISGEEMRKVIDRADAQKSAKAQARLKARDNSTLLRTSPCSLQNAERRQDNGEPMGTEGQPGMAERQAGFDTHGADDGRRR